MIRTPDGGASYAVGEPNRVCMRCTQSVARQCPRSLISHAALTCQAHAPVGWLQGLQLLKLSAANCRGMRGAAGAVCVLQ